VREINAGSIKYSQAGFSLKAVHMGFHTGALGQDFPQGFGVPLLIVLIQVLHNYGSLGTSKIDLFEATIPRDLV
jgi:hypothetical protein